MKSNRLERLERVSAGCAPGLLAAEHVISLAQRTARVWCMLDNPLLERPWRDTAAGRLLQDVILADPKDHTLENNAAIVE